MIQQRKQASFPSADYIRRIAYIQDIDHDQTAAYSRPLSTPGYIPVPQANGRFHSPGSHIRMFPETASISTA
jgi:hypothetical protein